ncbi:hypothetical protein [Inquilinus sp. CA228]|uniref:hypothetical protein n=1 Tax=Inquilinus sp. CA228 TaxID=3455609 RepID=UPI003F8D07B5
MRIVSLTLRNAATARESDKILAVLCTITHPELPQPLLISSDPSVRLQEDPPLFGTVSRGKTFLHIPMKAVLPGSDAKTALKAQFMFDNIAVARDLVPGLEPARVSDLTLISPTPARILTELVYSTTPDFVERRWPKLVTVNATIQGTDVVLDLARNNRAREPVPALTFNELYFPGLY